MSASKSPINRIAVLAIAAYIRNQMPSSSVGLTPATDSGITVQDIADHLEKWVYTP